MTATAARGCKAESLEVRGRAQVFRTSLRLLMLVPGTLRVCIEYGQVVCDASAEQGERTFWERELVWRSLAHLRLNV